MPSHAAHHGHAHDARPGDARPLALALGLTIVYAVVEAVGGWLTGSLALLADAGHMSTDVLALAIALFAARQARRPPDASRTYGYQRVEILAALFNGTALVGVAALVAREAWERWQTSPEVAWRPMAAIAAGGLAVNLVAARLLHAREASLNRRAAFLHVAGDLLGSIGALAAALAIGLGGFARADALAGAAIASILVVGAVRLVLESVHVLLEGAPPHLPLDAVRESLETTPGVGSVHDLHVWSLGGKTPLLTAHLVLEPRAAAERVLREATARLRERFAIDHATLQLEPPDFNIVQGLVDGGPSVTRRTEPPGPTASRGPS